MKEVQIISWCDACAEEDDSRVPATLTYTVGVSHGESRPMLKLVELCEPHAKLILDLEMLLQNVGQTPEFKKAAPVGRPSASEKYERSNPFVDCPIPGCTTSLRKSSVPAHIWAAHLPGVKKPRPLTKCPECGETEFKSLAMHRTMAHGILQTDELVELWRKNFG